MQFMDIIFPAVFTELILNCSVLLNKTSKQMKQTSQIEKNCDQFFFSVIELYFSLSCIFNVILRLQNGNKMYSTKNKG